MKRSSSLFPITEYPKILFITAVCAAIVLKHGENISNYVVIQNAMVKILPIPVFANCNWPTTEWTLSTSTLLGLCHSLKMVLVGLISLAKYRNKRSQSPRSLSIHSMMFRSKVYSSVGCAHFLGLRSWPPSPIKAQKQNRIELRFIVESDTKSGMW